MQRFQARWVGYALGGTLLAASWLTGCGTTYPGWLDDDDTGIGAAGRGGASGIAGSPIAPAGSGGRPAGGAGVSAAGGRTGSAGAPPAGGSGGSAGSSGSGVAFPDQDGDGVDASSDCVDLDPSISPGALDSCCDLIDNDCDGQDGPIGAACRCASDAPSLDRDGDGWTPQAGDCNDLDDNRFPGNTQDQCCDGFDADCDGRDEPAGVKCRCPGDRDGDGWPGGLGPLSDCDDGDFEVNPGVPESCGDAKDNDCDGKVDGSDDSCEALDRDADGFSPPFDCNDIDPAIHPKATEICGDARDNDCNGLMDRSDASCQTDNDNDGYDVNVDCDDANQLVHPGYFEVCGDSIDNDCDGLIDPYPLCTTDQVDWDGDGYPYAADCNDGDASIFPGSPWEACCDQIDSNCDGADGQAGSACVCDTNDADGDGYVVGNAAPGQADCNDQDPAINPGAPEICADTRDNDCDGAIDAADASCQPIPQ